MTVTVGRAYVVRIHNRPPAVAKVERILDDAIVVRLRQGFKHWATETRRVSREHIVREATPREVAVAMVIHPLPGEAA